jgi:hypothetical protein
MSDTFDLILAAYPTLDLARLDFEAVVRFIEDKQVRTDGDTYKQTSTTPIPTGDVTVKMRFDADEPTPGSGGTGTLWANDE